MPLPPAHFFAGAAAAELSRPSPLPAHRAWLAGGLIGVLPDIDVVVGVLLGEGTTLHGVFTHTSLALVTVALMAWWLGGPAWGRLAGAAYLSHFVLDVLENEQGTSVQLAWPFTGATLPSLAPLFPVVPWRQGEGPLGAARSLVEPEVVVALIAQTGIALALFAIAVLVRRSRNPADREEGPEVS